MGHLLLVGQELPQQVDFVDFVDSEEKEDNQNSHRLKMLR